MYDNHTINRCDAMEWLAKNLVEWPDERTENIYNFHGSDGWSDWYFVKLMSGDMVFHAYPISPINESDFYNFLHNYAGTELVRYGNEN